MLKILVTAILTSALLVGGAFGVYKHQEMVLLTVEDQTAINMAFLMLQFQCGATPAPSKGV